MATLEQKIKNLTWFDSIIKEKAILLELNEKAGASAEAITVLGATTNLPAVAATYATLADARTSVAAQNVAVEARLDPIESKVDEIITKLKAAGIITA